MSRFFHRSFFLAVYVQPYSGGAYKSAETYTYKDLQLRRFISLDQWRNKGRLNRWKYIRRRSDLTPFTSKTLLLPFFVSYLSSLTLSWRCRAPRCRKLHLENAFSDDDRYTLAPAAQNLKAFRRHCYVIRVIAGQDGQSRDLNNLITTRGYETTSWKHVGLPWSGRLCGRSDFSKWKETFPMPAISPVQHLTLLNFEAKASKFW